MRITAPGTYKIRYTPDNGPVKKLERWFNTETEFEQMKKLAAEKGALVTVVGFVGR